MKYTHFRVVVVHLGYRLIALDSSLQRSHSRVPFLSVIEALEQPATSQLQLKYLELPTKARKYGLVNPSVSIGASAARP